MVIAGIQGIFKLTHERPPDGEPQNADGVAPVPSLSIMRMFTSFSLFPPY